MAILNTRIREMRQQRRMTLAQVAQQLGVREATVQRYESGGIKNIKDSTVEALAALFGCTPEYLYGRESALPDVPGVLPLPACRTVPLLGSIACGKPLLAVENLEGEVEMPENIHADFALRCRGDSMIGARIMDGDIVYIRSQPDVDDGDIAAVLIEDEATLKRVYKIPGRVQLRPENPAYPVMEYQGQQLESIRILGNAVGFLSRVV